MTVTVTAEESHYIDAAANSAKFYRTYVFDSTWVTQYGRIDTVGKFTSRVTETSPDTASAAAGKKAASKTNKGYETVKTATLVFDGEPTDAQLDAAMTAAPGDDTFATSANTQADIRAAAVQLMNSVEFAADPAMKTAIDAALSKLDASAGSPLNTPVRPMLAETVDPNRLDELLDDPAWGVSPKLDGDRLVIEVTNGQVVAYNRQGHPKARNYSEAILEPFRHLTDGTWVFDGEVVNHKLWLFDIVTDAAYTVRFSALRAIVDILAERYDSLGLVGYITGPAGKRAALRNSIDHCREGIMLRRLDSRYEPGRRSPNLLKHKHVKECDAVVVAHVNGRQSVELGLYDDNHEIVNIGRVTTIGKGDIKPGDVLQIRFLYTVGDSKRLYQPRIVKARTDKTPAECSIRQLDHTATNKNL